MKKYFLILLIIGSLFSCGLMQETELTGNRAFEQKQYLVAAKMLQEELKNADKKDIEDKTLKIAQSYDYANKSIEAADWYKKYFELSKQTAYFYKYIEKQKSNNNYQKCADDLKNFIKQFPSEKIKAAYEIQQCIDADEWLKETSIYMVKKVDSINTFRNEYAPVAFDKSKIVFTSDRSAATGEEKYGWTGEKFTDFFVAEIKDGKMQRPRKFSSIINTAAHEGTCTFSRNYTTMIFTRCGSENSTDDYCQLFLTERMSNGEWTEPEKLLLFGADDTLQNIGQPFLTDDGKQLYFSSDAAGGLGGKDIYVSNKVNGTWSKPRNMGATINSSGDDVFPIIRKDGTLFFSSNGHGGMGGLDIFMSMKNGNKFGKAINLKSPMNSGADDFAMSYSMYESKQLPDSLLAVGYFSTSRIGGKGGDDIMRFEIKKEKIFTYWLTGTISENLYEIPNDNKSKVMDTLPVKKAVVQLFEVNKQTGMQHLEDVDSTDANGVYAFQIEKNKEYKIVAAKKDYFTKADYAHSKNIILPTTDTKIFVFKDVRIEKVIKNVMIEIPNIFYDLNKADIRTDAAMILDSVVLPLMIENQNLKFELGSHTDSRGDDEYNLKLSQHRADAVVEYLISKGIAEDRLIAKGYGETEIINRCLNNSDCTEEEHQQNRRTTFKVVE